MRRQAYCSEALLIFANIIAEIDTIISVRFVPSYADFFVDDDIQHVLQKFHRRVYAILSLRRIWLAQKRQRLSQYVCCIPVLCNAPSLAITNFADLMSKLVQDQARLLAK